MQYNTKFQLLCILDPQKAFTRGSWMKYFGEAEVAPIKNAFSNCVELLKQNQFQNEDIIFSRCPFPDNFSFEFEDCIKPFTAKTFHTIKWNNSIVYEADGKFIKFVDSKIKQLMSGLQDCQIQTIPQILILFGGCTLNSCVRVSAIDAQEYYDSKFAENKCKVQVIVDLSLCGARSQNYIKQEGYEESFVEKTIQQLKEASVLVTDKYKFVES